MTKTDVFINKAKVKHGDTYDYSSVKYVNNITSVDIICKIHGVFPQRPTDHLSGSGCKRCGRKRSEDSKRKTNEQFINEAINKYGSKYDYSKVTYVDNSTAVEIVCPIHGTFHQSPAHHLSGVTGCTKCGNEAKRRDQDNYITKANLKHDGKYDYSKVIYVKGTDPITIICPIHGEFQQNATAHLYYGCSKCGGNDKKDNNRFIEDAKLVHGDKYNYSKVNYITSKDPVTITCDIHGDFEQTPNAHLRGQGCKKCYDEVRGISTRLSQEEFIDKCNKIHNYVYSYDKTVYTRTIDKVTITCPIHNDFEQLAINHMNGVGCPKCSKEAFKQKVKTDKEVFVERARLMHNDDYEYDKLPDRINYSSKYDIFCNKCKVYFTQSLSSHVSGKGHLECSNQPMTNEEFIERSKEIHDDTYNYSLCNYVGSNYRVRLICPIHGPFSQRASTHLRGCGCFHCGRTKAIENTRTPINDYIRKAREIHGEKFDYSLVKFTSMGNNIDIICPTHGIITQRASGHLKYGCEQCHYESKLLTQEQFLDKAKEVHGDEYDYSEAIYKSNREPVVIICKKHGRFTQAAGDHIRARGCGCQICSSSKGEKGITRILNMLKIEFIKEFSFNYTPYRYDFCLPTYKILIEFDGEQHFRPVNLWGGESGFLKQQTTDVKKNLLALANNHFLIRIPYFKFDNLDKVLCKEISKLYPYIHDGKLYTTFVELLDSMGRTIDTEIRQDYDKYLLIKLIETH